MVKAYAFPNFYELTQFIRKPGPKTIQLGSNDRTTRGAENPERLRSANHTTRHSGGLDLDLNTHHSTQQHIGRIGTSTRSTQQLQRISPNGRGHRPRPLQLSSAVNTSHQTQTRTRPLFSATQRRNYWLLFFSFFLLCLKQNNSEEGGGRKRKRKLSHKQPKPKPRADPAVAGRQQPPRQGPRHHGSNYRRARGRGKRRKGGGAKEGWRRGGFGFRSCRSEGERRGGLSFNSDGNHHYNLTLVPKNEGK
jgi:hypothetical protein